MVETHDMGVQYSHLWNLAQAWGTYGTALYKNEALKEDILYSIEWLYTHYYGMAEIDGMDMLGFLRIRAWKAGQEKKKKEPKPAYIDEVWPNLK